MLINENDNLRPPHAYVSSHKHQNMHCHTSFPTGHYTKTEIIIRRRKNSKRKLLEIK
jgi:hypothetical protein